LLLCFPIVSLLRRATLLRPIEPTARILSHLCPAGLPRQLGSGAASHAGLAVDDYLCILGRARVAEPALEIFVADEEAVRERRNGDVDSAGDAAGILKFMGLADVCVDKG